MSFSLDAKTLAVGMNISEARAAVWLPRLGPAFELAEITNEVQAAWFLAQVGHESLSFFYTREVWGPTKQQRRYERDFSAPWPASPEQARTKGFEVNRLAYTLGNHKAGFGKRHMGRGLIQTTGLTNYILTTSKLRDLLGSSVPDFVQAPALLETPQWAALSAALFYRVKRLNRFVAAGDFPGQTRAINGGYHGLPDRTLRKDRLLRVLQ